jgi:hypothetical protein
MTRDEILNMPAGREMDALIAEKVMGECAHTLHNYAKDNRDDFGDYITWRCRKCKKAFRGLAYSNRDIVCEHYSTWIAAAWEVVEKMQGDWWKMEFLTGIHAAEFEKPNMKCEDQTYHEATADKMPLAICRAALLATLEG